MFATLLGALPLPKGDVLEDRIRTAIRAQEAAGLEPITDGRLRGSLVDMPLVPGEVVATWRSVAVLTDRAVKQALPGPYSMGRRAAGDSPTGQAGATERAELTARATDTLRAAIGALGAAGCPLIEIEETEAHGVGEDEAERAIFREAHQRLTDGVTGTHLSLSIVGGSAWGAGLETITGAPYASFAFDLIAGPDNWNFITRLPRERGVVAGALPGVDSPADAKEMLLWAARYAAASKGRGLDRVGLGSAGSWANLTWEAAVRKMERLGEAARLAGSPGGAQLAQQLDPRAVNARTAATGQLRPRRRDGKHAGKQEGRA